jgi:hypothetical protein
VTSEGNDSFWFAGKAWRHSLMEGIRIAAIFAITTFIVSSLGWIFRTSENLVSYLERSFLLSLLVGLPFLPIFAVWTRWDIWRGNRVRPK